MKYSGKLNGFWEEGYHYYIEIRDDKMTVRDYRRAVELETKISYAAKAIERGERAVISMKDNVLSRTAAGEPFTMIRELAWESGELKLLYYYTIMGETLYTLKKVDRGPFDHIKIRDGEFLKSLQGEWIRWRADGKKDDVLKIKNNKLLWLGIDWERFHVVSYDYSPDRVWIVPEDLTQKDFVCCTEFEVLPGMLTAREIIMDVNTPLSVFIREKDLDKVEIPAAAKEPAVNTMLCSERALFVDEPAVDVPVSKPLPDDAEK
ncbi:MAG: hypothetical protein IJV00_08115 [Clostridia bacterium]|nr:hypothetical protein [Clostridia bacterium]